MDKIIKSCLVSIVLLISFAGVTSTQVQEKSNADPRRSVRPEDQVGSSTETAPYHSPKEPLNCEMAGLYIDDAIMRSKGLSDSSLIIIARLGDGEHSQQLNRARLKEVQTYLEYHPDLSVVVAGGDRAKGYGRLEFYVGGRLLYTLPIQKNARLRLFNCIAV